MRLARCWQASIADASAFCRQSLMQISLRAPVVALIAIFNCAFFSLSATAEFYTVTNTNDSGAGSLREAITSADANPVNTITFDVPGGGTIVLGSDLPPVNTIVRIAGQSNVTVSGANQHRVFFVDRDGSLSIERLNIADGFAKGGDGGAGTSGGGGGLGSGGGLFINSGGSATLVDVVFTNNQAIGGNGGNGNGGNIPLAGGGGGGLSGDGGDGANNSSAGGGGGGFNGSGSDGTGSNGGDGGGPNGGQGGTTSQNGQAGGLGGGGGGAGLGTAGGGGGDFGGGGGGGQLPGGDGGYGGGGGGISGKAGYGGGNGGADNSGNGAGGDGGSGLGAAVFLAEGGGLRIQGSTRFVGNVAAAGSGGASDTSGTQGSDGHAKGNAFHVELSTVDIDVPNSSTISYSDSISGEGVLEKRGGGTLVLSDANEFHGQITVRAGTFRFGADDVFAPDTSIVVVGGKADLGSFDNQFERVNLIRGTITGTADGSLASDYDFSFSAGTVDVSLADGIESTGLSKGTSETLTLNAANTYTGATYVKDGLLVVNGSIAGDTHIQSAGTLGGHGSIGGTVINDGRMTPGNSIGTLQVGNLVVSSGSQIDIEFNSAGNVPGANNDLIEASGDVTLNGGDVNVQAASGNYSVGTRYTFLTYGGNLTGQFDSITDDLPLLDVGLFQEQGLMGFELLRNPTDYAALAETSNQLRVASYLDLVNPAATGDLGAVLDQINLQTVEGVQDAFEQLEGEINGTIAQLAVQNTQQVYLLLNRKLNSGASSFGGESLGGFAVAPSRNSSNGFYQDPLEAEPIIVRANGGGRDWKGFVTGYGLGGNARGDGNAAGGVYGIGGTVFAAQCEIDSDHDWGFVGSYSGFNLSTRSPDQSVRADDFQIGNFVRGDDGFNYYLLAGSVGIDDYRSRRHINLGAINRTAEGSYTGWQGSAWLERGVTFRNGLFDVQPFVALQYIYLRQNGFTEQGADALNLRVSGIETDSLRNVLGIYACRNFRTSGGQTWCPTVRALWLHEYLDTETSLNSVFAGTGGASFGTRGLNLGRDWAVLGCGLNWLASDRLSLYASYDLQLNAVQTLHLGSGGLQYVW
jgi:uncharacterized protein with beta-barrel porin domain